MKSIWLKGHEKNKEERRSQVQSAVWAFNLLEEVLEKEYKKKPLPKDYSDPQWVHKTIAANEYNRALDDLLSLIKINEG
jgi:hypothetical protein